MVRVNDKSNGSTTIIFFQDKQIFKTRFLLDHLLQTYFSRISMFKYLLILFGLNICLISVAESAIKKIQFAPKNLILGSYSADPQNDETFERLKKAGFNYVHTYRSSELDKNVKFLELARKYDMKVMFDLRGRKSFKDNGQEWLSGIMKNVERFKDYPSLGMWYLCDEPKTEMLPNVAKLRQEINKVSELPTVLVINWRKKWLNTRGYSDIWMVDSYPVRGQDFPNAPLQHYTTFVGGAAKRKLAGTPFMPVMQACDFTCFPKEARKLKDKSKLRYPNLTEMRFMGFSSLTYGVHGIFFYSYFHCHLEKPQGKTFFYEVLTPLLAEIKAFDTAVGQPWNVKQSFELNKRENVNLGYWARPVGDFMVLTNNSSQVRGLKINLTKEPGFPTDGKLIPWGATPKTDATLNRGTLSVGNVNPWATFIWQVKPTPRN